MSNQQEEQDLQKFLRDVDEISRLIQGLSSTDPAVQEKAIAATERRLSCTKKKEENECSHRLDRTLINTRPSGFSNQEGLTNPESFMVALEKDAKERARRRKENEAVANALKQQGNEAFGKGDYEAAVQKYTEGLKKQKDMQVLYTNRVQAHIKLQEYEKAIHDCEWALRCDEKDLKAFFHMGKAYLALKQYSKSRECYAKILEIDPHKEKLCKDCLHEVDLEEKKQREEEKATEEFESGRCTAVSVNTLLQKLSRPNENALFYAGGIQLLANTVQDGTEQTIFRTNNGFSIINDNEVIRRAFSPEMKSPAEVELSLSLILLWQAVCKENEENQRLLLTHPYVNLQLPTLLLSEVSEIQEQCLALLTLYAQTENGRSLLIRHLNLTKWLQTLMSFIHFSDSRASSAMNLLTSLVTEEKFKIQCRVKLSTEVLPLFAQLLNSVQAVNQTALGRCISVMGELCSDKVVRMQMAESQECWQAALSLVDACWAEGKATRYPECLHAVLALMMNLSLEPSLVIQELAEETSRRCMSLLSSQDGTVVTRAVGLLSRILPASPGAVEERVKQGLVKKMICFLKVGGQITSGYALKTLAVCTKSSRRAQEEILRRDKKCTMLLKLLRAKNEQVAGNAAFCLGRCLEVPGTATNLLGTDIVRILLKLAGGDAQKVSVQENAAIALGKLCTADARHTSRLRELNGMAVLSSSVKYAQGKSSDSTLKWVHDV
ncbi:tetratricopeptide repeat protein 12 isoform X2 [Eublepharis macularius]|uniref:Tetratricopeptide repeat protein 12 isoform X2 n=1 Tax=Eublepharis macularius TaxID=481883 RepID=A0AA97KCT7_EUBMA|nr:tetratricopeptide repeat protein 12 isoform X2 [Eublepharis macularius]